MPIRIPNQLPAARTLKDENIFVMTETRATTQDIRPLRNWSSSAPRATCPRTPPRSTCWPFTATSRT